MLIHPNECLNCGQPLKGRKGKKFCDPRCKASFHNEANQEKPKSFYVKVDQTLKSNRRILKHFNQGGLTTIRKDKLITEGFDPRFFTHYWKNAKGEVYLFCFEFGFLEIKKNGTEKYILVHWQEYMGKL